MSNRKYSDAFIDKEIAKIDKMNEEVQNSFIDFPKLDYYGVSEYTQTEIIKDINKLLKDRGKRSYIQGFWYGWSLRDGMKEKE